MIRLGINMEFVRHHDMSFASGVKKAAEIGYEYVEPMVHLGRELLSEAEYFHSVSMYNDPLLIKEICDANKIKMSGLSSHTPLCKPEISVEYLKMAIRFAAEMGVTNPFDPTQNIMGGTRYLRKLLDRYQGNLTLTLAAYNWGMGNLEKRPETLPTETKKYIAKIESLYRPQTESS